MFVRGAPARRRVRYSLAALAALSTLTSSPFPALATAVAGNPIGVHSMLYDNDPFGAKAAMFREAAAVGASTIRLDISLVDVFPTAAGAPDWTGIDQYMLLARRFHLRVLADLLGTPAYMLDCPPWASPTLSYRCPPANPRTWGYDAGLIAAHTRGVIDYFEIINEPDGGWAFYGTPLQYAEVLEASYRAIHAADRRAQVVLGGLMNVGSESWIGAVLSYLGAHAARGFDVANIHVRSDPAEAGWLVREWRRYFARHWSAVPLWVTETGYPADPVWQTDRGYRGGPSAQARYLRAAVPAMICAGAAKVFITERDSLTGRYASEGLLKTPDPLPADPTYVRRPSFYAIRALASTTSRAASASARRCVRQDGSRPG